VNVSLDGARAETHDRLRGVPGALERAEAGLRRLLEARARRGARVRVHLTMVLNPGNAPEVPELLDRARALGVDGLGLIPEHAFASARPELAAHEDGAPVDALVDGLLRLKDRDPLLENSRAYLESFRHALRGRPAPYPCSAWVSSLVVDPYGRLFPCVPYAEAGRRPVALAGRTVPEAARAEDYAAVRSEAHDCRDCHWNCHAELSLLFSGRKLLREAPARAPTLHADPRVQ
jgi:MoaA/NifB/PqqE/SkfB family radical SAM enzyme